MFIPAFPGLTPFDLVRPAAPGLFPFNSAHGLPFYRARNAIYHLFRDLRERRGSVSALVPEYHSGNEVLAMRAAGVTVHFAPVDANLQLDPDEVERRCRIYEPDVLYVIHYHGWPQRLDALAGICRRRGMLMIEDCALALFSAPDGLALGTVGDYAVFCLYKTLPVPNGAMLTQNTVGDEVRAHLLRRPRRMPVLARVADLMATRLHSRSDILGRAVQTGKRTVNRMAGSLARGAAPVGDIGFSLADVDLQMSALTARIAERQDHSEIRHRRLTNFRSLSAQLEGAVAPLYRDAPDGTCPLFLPILVSDKRAVAQALRRRGIQAIEFWNDTVDATASQSSYTRELRAHVLALPVHQDLSETQIAAIAREVSALSVARGESRNCRYAA